MNIEEILLNFMKWLNVRYDIGIYTEGSIYIPNGASFLDIDKSDFESIVKNYLSEGQEKEETDLNKGWRP